MTSAEKLFNVLANARTQAGGALPKEQWLAVAQKFLDEFKPARRVNILGKGLTDEEWFCQLENDPDCAGIDVRDEARKCRLYFKGKLALSRARIMKWLAKADATGYSPRSNGHSDLTPYKEPASEWRAVAQDLYPDSALAEQIRDGAAWFSLSLQFRQEIIRKL